MWTRHPPCPQSHVAEQKQKKRTFDVLPKPDKLTRYRHRTTRRGRRCGLEGFWGRPKPPRSEPLERNIRVIDGRPAALLRFRAIVLAVVRALAQALDPLAGKRHAIERLAILLPLRLA